MTTITRCEGRKPFLSISGDRNDLQCYEDTVACPKCGQDTTFCLECMKLSSESEPLCEECEGNRLELVRASTPENVERLVEALFKLANEASGFRCLADINRHGATNMRVLGDRVTAAFEALAPFKGVKP